MPLTGVRHELRKLRVQNPHWSLGDFAAVLHVSRERVRQLLVAEGLDTRRRTPRRIMQEALDRVSEQGSASPAVADRDRRTEIVMPLHNGPSTAQTPLPRPNADTGPIAEGNSPVSVSGTVQAMLVAGELPAPEWQY